MFALALLLSPQFVVAVNNPIMWKGVNSGDPPAAIGVSGYIGLDRHQALRLNYASYQVDNWHQISVDLTGDGHCGDGGPYGHSDDIGAGWSYFVRDRWHGLSLELGAVRKSMGLGYCLAGATGDFEGSRHTTSTAYVARAMLAWSWLYSDTLFASFGAGFSAGREAGSDDDSGAHFHQLVAYREVYFRVGFAFQ